MENNMREAQEKQREEERRKTEEAQREKEKEERIRIRKGLKETDETVDEAVGETKAKE